MRNILRWGAVSTAMLLVLAACTPAGSGSPGESTGESAAASVVSRGIAKIGVDLPQSGNEVANGEPTFRGVELAVKEANAAGGVGGYTIEINNQDDAVNGVHSPDQGAANARTLVADEAVVGMMGAFNSNVTRAIIPITNEAGLAQCSATNTGVDLTKEGSEVYRPQNPDQLNFFRLAAPDDIQGPAMAKFDYEDLGAKTAYVLDDTEAFGAGVADQFQEAFEALGGTVVKRDGQKYSADVNYSALFDSAAALNPDVVFFGGTQVTGGGLARKQMVQAGMGDVPFTGPDGIADLGVGGGQGAFITLAGVENSNDVYGSVAAVHDLPTDSDFAARFEAEYGKPAGAYSALAYACTQILLQAIAATADAAPDLAALRAAVREYVFDPANEYDTELGTIHFTERGDIKEAFISFYKVDPAAEDGKGGWVYIRQEAFEGN